MDNFLAKSHYNYNPSIISLIQRLSDIAIIAMVAFSISIFFHGINSKEIIFIFFISVFYFQFIAGLNDFYRSWRGTKIGIEIFNILKTWTTSCIFSYITIGLINISSLTSKEFIYIYVCTSFSILISRYVLRKILGLIRENGYNTKNIAIAGSLNAGKKLILSLSKQPWLGFNPIGIFDDNVLCDSFIDDNSKIGYQGDLSKLIKLCKKGMVNNVYIAMSASEEKKISNLVLELADTTCTVMMIPDIYTYAIMHSSIEEIDGVPMVSLYHTPMSGINMLFKRLEDIILSSLILALISPILVIISIAIKLTSPGKVIFKQKRYGIDGKSIYVWKFRTMTVTENGECIKQATKSDSRITTLGKILRRSSLDELPQFFNVLMGTMSIVGPRPHAIAHNEQFRNLIKGYMLRHKVKPGITGLAQIKGWRGETDTLEKMERRIDCDLEYIRNWSMLLDIKIILITLVKGFFGKNVY